MAELNTGLDNGYQLVKQLSEVVAQLEQSAELPEKLPLTLEQAKQLLEWIPHLLTMSTLSDAELDLYAHVCRRNAASFHDAIYLYTPYRGLNDQVNTQKQFDILVRAYHELEKLFSEVATFDETPNLFSLQALLRYLHNCFPECNFMLTGSLDPAKILNTPYRSTVLAQVFYEIAENSHKYLPADRKPEIRINAELEFSPAGDLTLAISMTDNGDGVAPRVLAEIKENLAYNKPFRANWDKVQGTGKGLLAIKNLPGIKFEISSIPGMGFTVLLKMPVEPITLTQE